MNRRKQSEIPKSEKLARFGAHVAPPVPDGYTPLFIRVLVPLEQVQAVKGLTPLERGKKLIGD